MNFIKWFLTAAALLGWVFIGYGLLIGHWPLTFFFWGVLIYVVFFSVASFALWHEEFV